MSTVNDQKSTVDEVLIINYYLNYSKIRRRVNALLFFAGNIDASLQSTIDFSLRRVNDSFIFLQEALTRLYIIFNFQLSIFNLNHSHSIVAGGLELMS